MEKPSIGPNSLSSEYDRQSLQQQAENELQKILVAEFIFQDVDGKPLYDYYSMLSIPEQSSEQEIKTALRKRLTSVHPDRYENLRVTAPKLYARLGEATQVLNEGIRIFSSPESRRQYDRRRAAFWQTSYTLENAPPPLHGDMMSVDAWFESYDREQSMNFRQQDWKTERSYKEEIPLQPGQERHSQEDLSVYIEQISSPDADRAIMKTVISEMREKGMPSPFRDARNQVLPLERLLNLLNHIEMHEDMPEIVFECVRLLPRQLDIDMKVLLEIKKRWGFWKSLRRKLPEDLESRLQSFKSKK